MDTTRRQRRRAETVGVKEEEEVKAKERILVHFIPTDGGTGGTNTDRRV